VLALVHISLQNSGWDKNPACVPRNRPIYFWYKLFVESTQTAPNQYRMADNSSLLCVEMRLCNLAMNRIERVLLHNVHKPKDIRSISWMFLCHMAVLND